MVFLKGTHLAWGNQHAWMIAFIVGNTYKKTPPRSGGLHNGSIMVHLRPRLEYLFSKDLTVFLRNLNKNSDEMHQSSHPSCNIFNKMFMSVFMSRTRSRWKKQRLSTAFSMLLVTSSGWELQKPSRLKTWSRLWNLFLQKTTMGFFGFEVRKCKVVSSNHEKRPWIFD